MKTQPESPRKTALSILGRLSGPADGEHSENGYLNLLLDSAIKKSNPPLSDADRGLLTLLTAGVTERRITLDYIIGQLSDRETDRIDPRVLDILRMGIYQLRYADRIPVHAAIYETVELAPAGAKSFVNGILRAYQRKADEIELPKRPDKPVLPEGDGLPKKERKAYNSAFNRFISVNYSLNPSLAARLTSAFGEDRAVEIAAAFFSAPRPTLRVNTLKTDREALSEKLRAEGFETAPTKDSPYGLKIVSGHGLPSAVREGLCFVQDEASQICGAVLDAQPGDRVIDVCSCPGSKAFSAAMQMKNRGEIIACDIHSSKLPLIENGAKRNGIKIIKTVRRDSSEDFPGYAGKFDRIICDVPCSGFGVLAKKPELRYKLPEVSAGLPELQYAILSASAKMLKKGGRLVYSTCTLIPAENGCVTERFLAEHPDFEASDFTVGDRKSENGMLTLTPDGGTDGFFIAAIERK
ncbi:MAG: 16S rRNA (cytosine(967)-C(5))-methyltransferase RsmB [Clostridia bacterium]|nr:16S rRNA (cytosine(967)-C(5))-methyltransferase RsmB [Clostridia bacterium]